jgi:hypothetical protein
MDAYIISPPFMATEAVESPFATAFSIMVPFDAKQFNKDSQLLDVFEVDLLVDETVINLITLTLDDASQWNTADKNDGITNSTVRKVVSIEPQVPYRLRIRAYDNDLQVGSFRGIFVDNIEVSNGVILGGADPTADFDDDGDVDGDDFLAWQRHVGGPGDLSDGDADGNGQVTSDDLAVWKEQFGGAAAAAHGAAVPEPASVGVCLLAAGGAPIAARRRRYGRALAR